MESERLTDLQLQQVGETETIIPIKPTDSEPVYLSNIDQSLVFPIRSLHFFPPRPERPLTDLVPMLRDALGKVLVQYHFLAGRLRRASSGRLEIDCNRSGAEFAHYRSGLQITDLGDIAQPNPLYRQLVPDNFDIAHVFSAPLLAVQVTTFACGGFTVGFMTNHSIMDGVGTADFFLNFASVARGEGILFTPNYDRSPLMARTVPVVKYDHEEIQEISANHPVAAQIQTPFTTGDLAAKEVAEWEKKATNVVTKIFPFTPEMIEILKKRALEGGVLKSVSTFNVLAAQTWLARTKAVELPEGEPFNLLFAVDIRRIMKPALPEHFAGNAVSNACARATPSQVKNYSFTEAVQVIQNAAARVTDDYVRSSLDLRAIKKGVPGLFGGFQLVAWWKLPFHAVDYGWGKPIYAGPLASSRKEFVLLLSNGKEDGGVNLKISLEPEQMAKFQEFVKV